MCVKALKHTLSLTRVKALQDTHATAHVKTLPSMCAINNALCVCGNIFIHQSRNVQ